MDIVSAIEGAAIMVLAYLLSKLLIGIRQRFHNRFTFRPPWT